MVICVSRNLPILPEICGYFESRMVSGARVLLDDLFAIAKRNDVVDCAKYIFVGVKCRIHLDSVSHPVKQNEA